jgi:Glycosyltransferase family 87
MAGLRIKGDWLLQYGLGLLCLGLVLGFALLHAVAPHVYIFFTRIPDGAGKWHPFVDLRAILQGGACWRAGVDVYRPSPCLGGGIFNYSPLLLRAARLPIGPQDALAGGLLFCCAYAAALCLLPRPANWREFWLRAAASFSPAGYYALEQGNLDTLIFAAVVLMLRLGWRRRGWGYAVFALGAAAKFYPVALFALALRESRRIFFLLAVAGLGLSLLALVFYGHGLMAAVVSIPSGTPFRASFGRIDFTRGLVMLHLLPRGTAQLCSWVLALGTVPLARWRRPVWARHLARLGVDEAAFLVAGAAVTAFCFMAAQNIEYRAIFLLLTLPALVRFGRLLPWVVLALLWEAVPRALLSSLAQPYLPHLPGLCLWLLREGLWWWLVVEFMAIALAFADTELKRLKIDAARPSP